MSSEEGGKGYLYTSKTFNLASDRFGGCALTVNIYEQTCMYLERSIHLLFSESVREKYVQVTSYLYFSIWGDGGRTLLNFGLYRVYSAWMVSS
jgi:hypothetical protein